MEASAHHIAAVDGDLCHIGEQVWDGACSADINNICHAGVCAGTSCEQEAGGDYIQALQPAKIPYCLCP